MKWLFSEWIYVYTFFSTSSSFVIYDATEREDDMDDESHSHLDLDNGALLVPQINLISQKLNHDNLKKM